MGRLGFVISVEPNTEDGEDVRDVKIDIGGGESLRVPLLTTPGIDAVPLPGDYVATISNPGDSGESAVAFADGSVDSLAQGGEIRLAGRKADHVVVSEVWIRGDGSVRVQNDNGFFELETGGRVNINGNLTVEP